MTRKEKYQDAINLYLKYDRLAGQVMMTLEDMDKVYNFLSNNGKNTYFTPSEIAIALGYGYVDPETEKIVNANYQRISAVLYRLLDLHLVNRVSYKKDIGEPVGVVTCYRWTAC